MDRIANILIKLAAAVTIVAAAFGINPKIRLLINTVVFFGVNFLFAGVIYAVYVWLKPDFIHFNNSYFYIDFSLVILVLTTAGLYFAICIIRRLTDRIPENAGCYKIIIRYRDRITSIDGLADTGNSLIDFFSGCPVIICSSNFFSDITGIDIIPDDPLTLPKGFRLIPCSTVSGSGIIPVFRPDEIIICNEKNGMRKNTEAMIGFGTDKHKAVFNPRILK
jgi:stage II sporulation protein GA (sporulation sigma-E factor processing peptidase)